MLYKNTFLFQVETVPTDASSASAHTGGWSESFWSETLFTPASLYITRYLQKRANLLPSSAAIVGFRRATYEIQNSSLVPKGATSTRVRQPGSSSLTTDLPQVALEMGGSATSGNGNRFSLKGMPDNVMIGGEYQPPAAFKRAMTIFCNEMVDAGHGFIGRDLNAVQPKILSIAANVMTVSADLTPVLGQTIVTFLRVRDTKGVPIVGNFRIVASPGALQYTLEGLPTGTVVGASGYARKMVPIYCNYDTVQPSRAVARKVGAPFERYRGRASKKRTA